MLQCIHKRLSTFSALPFVVVVLGVVLSKWAYVDGGDDKDDDNADGDFALRYGFIVDIQRMLIRLVSNNKAYKPPKNNFWCKVGRNGTHRQPNITTDKNQ